MQLKLMILWNSNTYKKCKNCCVFNICYFCWLLYSFFQFIFKKVRSKKFCLFIYSQIVIFLWEKRWLN